MKSGIMLVSLGLLSVSGVALSAGTANAFDATVYLNEAPTLSQTTISPGRPAVEVYEDGLLIAYSRKMGDGAFHPTSLTETARAEMLAEARQYQWNNGYSLGTSATGGPILTYDLSSQPWGTFMGGQAMTDTAYLSNLADVYDHELMTGYAQSQGMQIDFASLSDVELQSFYASAKNYQETFGPSNMSDISSGYAPDLSQEDALLAAFADVQGYESFDPATLSPEERSGMLTAAHNYQDAIGLDVEPYLPEVSSSNDQTISPLSPASSQGDTSFYDDTFEQDIAAEEESGDEETTQPEVLASYTPALNSQHEESINRVREEGGNPLVWHMFSK